MKSNRGLKILAFKYKEFLQSSYWKEVRDAVFARDGACIKCGVKDNLHAHHLTYKHHYKELEHLKDLITLCIVCHTALHNKKNNNKNKIMNHRTWVPYYEARKKFY